MVKIIKTRCQSPENKMRVSKQSKELWQKPEYRQKMLNRMNTLGFHEKRTAGLLTQPTKPESIFGNLTPNTIHYTGNGSWWRRLLLRLSNGEYIEVNKNPDFKVDGQRKVIEIYGDYWHRNDKPQDIIDAFARISYQCMVIWEHEIHEDIKGVLDRVAEFVGTDCWQMSLSV